MGGGSVNTKDLQAHYTFFILDLKFVFTLH
jgi:hypothetical protein